MYALHVRGFLCRYVITPCVPGKFIAGTGQTSVRIAKQEFEPESHRHARVPEATDSVEAHNGVIFVKIIFLTIDRCDRSSLA